MRDPHHAEQPGLIVRQKYPLNVEFPFSSLTTWEVPTDHFFVRNHFPIPQVDAGAWKLEVHGHVERPFTLDLAGLQGLEKATFAATVECAGNGRVFYEPAREGLQWQNGAVGNATWTGVPLRALLEEAGIAPGAAEVVLVGADRGVVDAGKKTASPGPIAFARSIPVDKALDGSVLLAHTMNGAPLTAEHGYPLRAVVGGWFGMAWVKWLTAIRVVDRPFLGYWQARDYFAWDRTLGEPTLAPLTRMEVKSVISRPVNGAIALTGRPVRIFGAAWSGEHPIDRVEVSVDGGDHWQAATLLAPAATFAWRLWEHRWTPDAPGTVVLMARAIDAAGNVQPDTQQQDRESYVANWTVPVEVRVVADGASAAEEFMI